jgi:hypothetical protein
MGKSVRKPTLIIPLEPDLVFLEQYKPLSLFGRENMSALAQHLCSLKHPDYPEARAVSVKIYRVVHNIAPSALLAKGLDPAHPATFLPFYQGQYDPKGDLKDAPKFDTNGTLVSGDPFLYWLVPIIADPRDQPITNESAVMGWVFKHAGDPKWYRHHGSKKWSEEDVPFQERAH